MTLDELYDELGGVRILGQTENGKLLTQEDATWLRDVWVMCHEYSETDGREIFMDYIGIQFNNDIALVNLIEHLVMRVARVSR